MTTIALTRLIMPIGTPDLSQDTPTQPNWLQELEDLLASGQFEELTPITSWDYVRAAEDERPEIWYITEEDLVTAGEAPRGSDRNGATFTLKNQQDAFSVRTRINRRLKKYGYHHDFFASQRGSTMCVFARR